MISLKITKWRRTRISASADSFDHSNRLDRRQRDIGIARRNGSGHRGPPPPPPPPPRTTYGHRRTHCRRSPPHSSTSAPVGGTWKRRPDRYACARHSFLPRAARSARSSGTRRCCDDDGRILTSKNVRSARVTRARQSLAIASDPYCP